MTNYEQYYSASMQALTKYISEKRSLPTEKVWNKIAVQGDYLTSQSLGYLSGIKFPELCKKIYKEIQKKGKAN